MVKPLMIKSLWNKENLEFRHTKFFKHIKSFKIIFRIVPKQWTHGLRDNEFAQRILVQRFSDLASNRNNPMIDSIKNLLCVVDER